MHQCFVAHENASDDKTDQVRRQNGFAFRGRGETAKKKQNEEDKFYFRFTHASRTQFVDDPFRPCRHEPQHHTHRDDKGEQPKIVIRKQSAERENRPKIGDETRRENHLAHCGVAESAFDHHRVNHRN